MSFAGVVFLYVLIGENILREKMQQNRQPEVASLSLSGFYILLLADEQPVPTLPPLSQSQ